jgi:hypothetical protein
VRVTNGTAAAIRVWRSGSAWGDLPLAFVVRAGGAAARVRWQGRYTRNVPATVDVPAGCAYVLAFDLADRAWRSDAPFAGAIGPGATLTAEYNVPADPAPATHHVWTGQVTSAPTAWRP